jgi:hypothetical protein
MARSNGDVSPINLHSWVFLHQARLVWCICARWARVSSMAHSYGNVFPCVLGPSQCGAYPGSHYSGEVGGANMFSRYSFAVCGPSQCGAYPGSHYSGVVVAWYVRAARWARVSPMARSNDDVSPLQQPARQRFFTAGTAWYCALRSLGPSVTYGPQLRRRFSVTAASTARFRLASGTAFILHHRSLGPSVIYGPQLRQRFSFAAAPLEHWLRRQSSGHGQSTGWRPLLAEALSTCRQLVMFAQQPHPRAPATSWRTSHILEHQPHPRAPATSWSTSHILEH